MLRSTHADVDLLALHGEHGDGGEASTATGEEREGLVARGGGEHYVWFFSMVDRNLEIAE